MSMSSRTLKELFLAALDVAPQERAQWLERECAGDSCRRQQLELMLAAHDSPQSLLDEPAAAPFVPTVTEPSIAEVAGSAIGPYKLLEQIGEGGFGIVFLAEQTQPVRRKVALKVLKPGMDTRQVVARFEAERQALAIMDHPNIARVFDGGATAAGRPFFVMELVKGIPITTFCDRNHLTPRQRLELFVPVCQAVQHAHQKGIVHRDLKPSNVLVTMHDTVPVVKVIDFGVAKALGQELTDKSLFTGFAQMIGTPLYMSPEQAGESGLDIDTRSDIYSLGVLLYELLTGTTPLSHERFRKAAYDEIRRIIREEEPPKPSTRLSESTDVLPSIAANRSLEPKKLSGLVRGELDWIVMKALEKDRNRRYETANGFAQDIQRYLADEPVQACPPSAGYRLRKFARRNKGGLAVGALVLFFLVLLGSGAGWVWRDRSAQQAEAARQQLERELEATRQEALRESQAARQKEERQAKVAGQVESIFADVDRLEQEQKWSEALAAVRRAEAAVAGGDADETTAQRVRERLKDVAFIVELDHIREEWAVTLMVVGTSKDADVSRRYGEAFRVYGVDVEALPVEESRARLQGKPALAAAIAAALDDWVDARRNLDEGVSSWKPLVAVARGLDHDPLRDRLRAVWGQPVTPELRAELLQLATSIDVRAQRPGTLQVLARTLHWAAARADVAQTRDRAQQQLVDAAQRILQSGQQAHPADFWLNVALGGYLSMVDDADRVRYRSVAVSLRPDSAEAHLVLGSALRRHKKLDEAIAEMRKALELEPRWSSARLELGMLLFHEKGEVDAAMVEFQKSIELNPKSTTACYCHSYLGQILRQQGKLDEAIAEIRQAIELYPKYWVFHEDLGKALFAKGRVDEAIAEFRTAVELLPKSGDLHHNLGVALKAKGDLDAAENAYREATRLDGNQRGPAIVALADLLLSRGKVKEALEAARKAVALDEKSEWAWQAFGWAHYRAGDWQASLEALEKSCALQQNPPGGDTGQWFVMAMAHWRLGHEAEARKLFHRAEEWTTGHGADGADGTIADFWGEAAELLDIPGLTRGRYYVLRSQWNKAAAAYEKVDPWARPLREDVVFSRACLHLLQGDSEGYDRFCRDMLQRVPQTEDHFEAFVLARSCAMARKGPVDPAQAVQWAKQAVAGDQPPWYLHALGLAQFRAGQFEEALQSFTRANVEAWTYRDLNWFGMALVHQRLGNSDEARQCLDKGIQWLDRYGPPGPGGKANIHPIDWLEAHVLRRELEDLLTIKKSD